MFKTPVLKCLRPNEGKQNYFHLVQLVMCRSFFYVIMGIIYINDCCIHINL